MQRRETKQVCSKAVTRYIDMEVDELIDIQEWIDCETGQRRRV